MSELEQVSKGMMEELNDIRAHILEYQTMPSQFLNDVLEGNYVETSKWYWQQMSRADAQFKLIEHVFGDTPQFEEEKANKYIVRTKEWDDDGNCIFLYLDTFNGLTYPISTYDFYMAEKFDTREEAEKWTNPLMEVVEVEDE